MSTYETRTLRRKGELAGWKELGTILEQGTCLSECLVNVCTGMEESH